MIQDLVGKYNGEKLYFISAQTPEERKELGIPEGMTGFWQTESGQRLNDSKDILRLATSHFSEGGPSDVTELTSERTAREVHRRIYNEQREMIMDVVKSKREQFSKHPDPHIRKMLLEGIENLEKIYAKKDDPLVDVDGVFRPDQEKARRVYGDFVKPEQ